MVAAVACFASDQEVTMKRLFAISLTALLAACGGGDADDHDPRAAVSLPGETLYPEGIALAADGTMLVGSLREGSIVRVAPEAEAAAAEPFAAAGDNGMVSTVGLHADPERGLLWACSSDPGVSPRTGTSPPALKSFDLETGDPAGSAELPDGGFCNDIAADREGNLYVSDSFAPRILILRAGESELTTWLNDPAFAGEGFNLNGLAVADGALHAVKYNTGELFRIPIGEDGAAGAPEVPDGLRAAGDDLIVVEGVGRLTRVAPGGTVTTLAEGLAGPTSVAIAGPDAWVVEGQLGHLFDPDSGAPALPFQVVRVPL
jgi:sugar lactone lactonase YvrE